MTEWRKSSSSAMNGNCVEVASLPGRRTAVRDSKDPGPRVLATREAFRDLLEAVKRGEHGLPS